MSWRVGIDTGGTFTDLVAARGGELRVAKVPSTPPSFERGVFDAIEAAGIPISEIAVLAHGTTVATNAFLTREGADTALLTTAGFRDVLELRRHNRGELYDILWDPPEPVVRRRHRFEIRERVNYAGVVLEPLSDEDVQIAVEQASAAGIGSFAICFLHSYVSPEHERRARDLVLRLRPDAYVYCSSDLLREPGEFERTSTVAVNAYLGPVVSRYLDALARALSDAGFGGRLFVMHSGGGLLTADTAVRIPARLLTSGPAAGALAAERLFPGDVISLDMGGTSADIAVVREGRARLVNEYAVEFGSPIRFPAIDLTTIGAGGGSIASIDAQGLPTVGPRSAGSVPGPAAYGRGGVEACVTDACVVLGRLSEETPLAGGVTLDVAAARAAVERFAAAARLPLEETALGIVEIANSNMARAIRLVTVERGLDPRTFSLVVFGGAGGLHGAELADLLAIDRVVMPVAPGVTSALGCLYADVVHDVGEALIAPLATTAAPRLLETFDRLVAQVEELLDADRIAPEARVLELSIDLRYEGQRRGLTLPVERRELDEGFADAARARFWVEYETQFQYVAKEVPVEIAALRVRGHGLEEKPTLAERSVRVDAEPVPCRVWTKSGPAEALVHERRALRDAEPVAGPAIVREYDATTWVPPGWVCELDHEGHLVLTRSAPREVVAAAAAEAAA